MVSKDEFIQYIAMKDKTDYTYEDGILMVDKKVYVSASMDVVDFALGMLKVTLKQGELFHQQEDTGWVELYTPIKLFIDEDAVISGKGVIVTRVYSGLTYKDIEDFLNYYQRLVVKNVCVPVNIGYEMYRINYMLESFYELVEMVGFYFNLMFGEDIGNYQSRKLQSFKEEIEKYPTQVSEGQKKLLVSGLKKEFR